MSLPASPSAVDNTDDIDDAETTLHLSQNDADDDIRAERLMQEARPTRTYSRPWTMSDASVTQIGSPIFTSTPVRPKSPTVTSTVVDSGIGTSGATGVTTTAAEPNGGETAPTEPPIGTIFSDTPEWLGLEPLPTTRMIYQKKRKTLSSRAGLTLNVRRIHKYLKAGKYAKRITMMGAVYMTGVLEYLTAEMMELAGNAASTNKKKRITPRHVMLAVAFDQELYSLFDAGKVIMPGAGVAPFIHKELLPKNADETVRKKSKSAAKEASTEPQHKDVADSTTALASPPLNPSLSPKSWHSQEY